MYKPIRASDLTIELLDADDNVLGEALSQGENRWMGWEFDTTAQTSPVHSIKLTGTVQRYIQIEEVFAYGSADTMELAIADCSRSSLKYSSRDCQQMYDGNVADDDFWLSGSAQEGQWGQVELYATSDVTRVVIKNRESGYQSRIDGAVVSLRSEAGDVLASTTLAGGAGSYDLSFDTGAAQAAGTRYVRITATKDSYLMIPELSVWGAARDAGNELQLASCASKNRYKPETDDYVCDHAMDGQLTGRWYKTRNGGATGQWVQYELARESTVTMVWFLPRAPLSRADGVVVTLLSREGDELATATLVGEPAVHAVKFSDVTRGVTAVRFHDTATTYMQFLEVRVFGDEFWRRVPILDCSASSTWSTIRGCENLYDGDTAVTDFFHTLSASADEWVQVELFATTTISKIRIYNRDTSCCRGRAEGILVELLTADGTSLSSQSLTGEPAYWDLWWDLEEQGGGVRFVRLTATENQYINLSELQVYGVEKDDSLPGALAIAGCTSRNYNADTQMCDKAIDGTEFSGFYKSDYGGVVNQWIEVQLAARAQVRAVKVAVQAPYSYIADFEVALKDRDGETTATASLFGNKPYEAVKFSTQYSPTASVRISNPVAAARHLIREIYVHGTSLVPAPYPSGFRFVASEELAPDGWICSTMKSSFWLDSNPSLQDTESVLYTTFVCTDPRFEETSDRWEFYAQNTEPTPSDESLACVQFARSIFSLHYSNWICYPQDEYDFVVFTGTVPDDTVSDGGTSR